MNQFHPVQYLDIKTDRKNVDIWVFETLVLFTWYVSHSHKITFYLLKTRETVIYNVIIKSEENRKQKKQFYYYTQMFDIFAILLIHVILFKLKKSYNKYSNIELSNLNIYRYTYIVVNKVGEKKYTLLNTKSTKKKH